MNLKIKKLKKVFNPRSIAVIGASSEINSVGWGLVKNTLEGKRKRKIFAVNPYRKKVLGIKCLPSIKSIKGLVDLALIAVPAKIVPRVVKECCQKKVGGIVIISAGFAEKDKKGRILQEKVKNITQKASIPLIGPNCLGVIRPAINLNASFASASPKKGEIGFISQSGALIDSIIDQSLLESYGFSSIISYGNQADLSLSDFLEWLGENKETKVITLYLEGLKDGRRFLKIASRVSKLKPIVVIKAGRTEIGKKAISSHTASLAGDYQIYKAAFHQSGLVEVETLEELFDTAKALAWQPRIKNGIAIITNGGGCGVLLADYCQELSIKLPKLKKRTIQKIEKPRIISSSYSKRNPLDIIGDALSEQYRLAIESVLGQDDIKGLIVIQTLQIMTEVEKNAKIIIEAKKRWPKKAIVSSFLGGKLTRPGIKLLEENKIPNYSDLKRAAQAMRSLIKI